MCGICGFVTRKDHIAEDVLLNMTNELWRRGPDDRGILLDGPFAMGMRRLSIIDIEGGHQPIFNEDRSVAVVCNGEIYNYQCLRKKLIANGHSFRSDSDSEVIVHLYEEYGDRFVEQLNGMFAFSIYDKKRRRIVLGRDRLGIKPLFYSQNQDSFIFGSEIKSILKFPSVSTDIDLQALDEYLTYTYVPCPKTIYSSIKKVPPGHIVVINRDLCATFHKYWSLETPIDDTHSETDWILNCEEKLQEAVVSHLVSDVPVGAFLSGGIDSSLIVAMTATAKDEPIDTFTIAFKNSGDGFLDERLHAREMGKRYNLRQHEIEVSPDFDDIEEDLISAFDEPFADDSLVPMYYVCQATSRNVKVALSGLGGDELFGGYIRHLGLIAGEYYRRIPNFLHEFVVAPVVSNLKESTRSAHFVDRLKRFVRAARLDPPQRYQDALSSLRSSDRSALYTDGVAHKIDLAQTEDIISQHDAWKNELPLLEAALRTDISTYLTDDILALTDRLSMWHSLEVRVPFLDHKFVETVASMPPSMKIRHRTQKYVLRKIAEKWVPSSILKHKKQGFESPMGNWLAGPLQSKMRHYLGRHRLERQGIFKPDSVERLINQHISRSQQNSKILFSLLMFQLWMSNTNNEGL